MWPIMRSARPASKAASGSERPARRSTVSK
jgi:hypothetical protein